MKIMPVTKALKNATGAIGRAAVIAGFSAACLIAAGLRADAQTMDYGALQQLFGEPVTTSATGSPQREADVPANMEIISSEDIRRSGADNIPDILQFVAGVDVRRYGIGDAEVSVRGYNQQFSPRLLVLINGRQVYLDDYGHTAWQSLPVQIDEIRQIEVVKGPNSALFGFNAAGGVINIITFDPLLDSTNAAAVRAGTQSSIGASAVLTLHDGDQAGLRLSAGGFRAREFSISSLPVVVDPYNKTPSQYALSADGRLKLNSNVELTAEGTLSRARRLDALPVPNFYDDDYRTNSLKLGIAADTRFGLLDFAVYRNEMNFVLNQSVANVAENNVVYVLQASDLFKLGTDHTIRVGVEVRDNTDSSAIFGGKIGYSVYAASVMWNWQIEPELALTNAVRYDYLKLRYAGTPVAGIKFAVTDYSGEVLRAASFNSGFVYKPSDSDTFRLLVARGTQAPSLVDLGLQTTGSHGGLQISFIGNPEIEAASVTNYEIDYDRTLPSINAILRAAAYYQRTADLVTSAVNFPLAPGAGGLVSYAQNVGSSRAAGGEIGINGTSELGIRWSASYSLISIDDHLSIGPLTGQSQLLAYKRGSPANVVDLGAGYSWDRLDVDVQVRWQSHFTDFQSAATGAVFPVRINDYMTLHARVAYRVTDAVTVALVGEQLGRSKLFDAAGPPVERRIMASVTGHFE